MSYSTPWFSALGGLGLPSYEGTEGLGREVTIVGGAVSKGEPVRICTDDNEPALDASKAFGPTSWQHVYEKLATGDSAAFVNCGTFAIALEDIADDGKGRVLDFGLCKALVTTSGAVTIDTPLMPDFTNQVLVAYDGTGKCVAKTATEISGAVTASEQIVLFSGLLPLANAVDTTA